MSTDSTATVDQLLLEQLETAELPMDAYDLVLSVVLDQNDLHGALGGTSTLPDQAPSPPTADAAPLAAYLSRIEVRGFRGIGESAILDLVPGPGLTVVTGRNGSGKSTFAEAAELTLTGDDPGWAQQGPQWREGWRNLHVEGERRITVGLAVDGHPGGAEVVCRWAAEADLEQRTTFLQRAGQTRQRVADLGWERPMRLFRPFLSYADLGKLLRGKPSEMYDSLHNVLGLGRLADVENRLKAVRRDSVIWVASMRRRTCRRSGRRWRTTPTTGHVPPSDCSPLRRWTWRCWNNSRAELKLTATIPASCRRWRRSQR